MHKQLNGQSAWPCFLTNLLFQCGYLHSTVNSQTCLNGYLQLTVNGKKHENCYLQLNANSQKPLEWLFTVDCQ